MFLKIGNEYFNTTQIKRIRPFEKPDQGGCYVTAELLDGSSVEGYCHEERVTMLTRHYLPAPPEIEVSTWASGDAFKPRAELRKETLIGFAFDGFNDLSPVTVESGVVESAFNIRFKDGRVRASWGEEFGSEVEMIAAARTRFAKEAS